MGLFFQRTFPLSVTDGAVIAAVARSVYLNIRVGAGKHCVHRTACLNDRFLF
jgi:hypothetical protein